MRIASLLIRTIFLALLLSVYTLAADSNTLIVKCVDNTGKPISKVKVFVQGLGLNDTTDEKANNQGIATFKKLDNDFYRVWAHQEGFAPSFHEYVTLDGGETKNLTLTFEPGDAEDKLYFEDKDLIHQAQVLLQQGAQAYQNRQFETAEENLKKSIEINPSEPNAYYNLGLVYSMESKWDEAEKVFKKAVELLNLYKATEDPSNPVFSRQAQEIQQQIDMIPLRKLAQEIDRAMKAQEFDKAIAGLHKMAEIQPDNPAVYFNLAINLTRLNKLDEADAALDKAIALNPDDQAFKDLKKRIAEVQAARAKNAEKARVVTVQELIKDGKPAEAIEKAKAALQDIDPKYHEMLWEEMTVAYLALEQYPEAIDARQKVLELKGEPVDQGLFDFGQEFVRKGKQAQARMVFEKVLQVNPNFAEAYYQLGMDYFYELNDKARAKEMLEKYLELGKDENNLNNAKNVLVVMGKS